ncbi:DNA polymerase III subunit epsilon [Gammaproteobacteria bacterium]|nr:DNA polymerase III subunit epsilon [Gammaproteobacteria bacterium]
MIYGVLDIETTGLDKRSHRMIEVGIRLIQDRKIMSEHFHEYVNPQRAVDPGAFSVHGISDQFLKDKPTFDKISGELKAFILRCDAIVIHNAAFDQPFLKMEFARIDGEVQWLDDIEIIDSLVMARKTYPGQRNNLDALCDRLSVSHQGREYHGALKDADILAEVYLALTRNQYELGLQGRSDHQPQEELALLRGFDYSYPLAEEAFLGHATWLSAHPNHQFQEESKANESPIE